MDNIELRSEKARNIIGQIPPLIMRIGITIIFAIVIVLLLFAYYFKYPYLIAVEGKIISNSNNSYCEIKVPSIYESEIKASQKITIYLNNISYLKSSTIESKIEKINNNIEVYSKGAYIYAVILLPSNYKFIFKQNIDIKAEIKIGDYSLVERYIKWERAYYL